MFVAPVYSLEVRSQIVANGTLTLSLEKTIIPGLAEDEVLIRVEASPINPSDIGLLLSAADLGTLHAVGGADKPVTTAAIPTSLLQSVNARLNLSLPVGNEGAGTVVATGESTRALLGRVVATQTPGMYAQFRIAKASNCLILAEGTAPRQAASAFINPLTVLSMIETMRREGHTALVHTAAASSLGQMLHRVCTADDIALINIVRNPQQVELLRAMGARYVLDSTTDQFEGDLTDALAATGATLAFDAIGGGPLAAIILSCMEAAAARNATAYNRYGSPIHKQVYMYGVLDKRAVEIPRNFGMAWGVGGWLMTWFLQKIGSADVQRLRDRVAAELTTTFASQYVAELTLADMLQPNVIEAYNRSVTGGKFLVTPQRS